MLIAPGACSIKRLKIVVLNTGMEKKSKRGLVLGQTGEIINILINSFRNIYIYIYNIKFITNNIVKRIKQLLSARYDKKEVHFKF